jgi:hypothetical protein
MARDNNKNSLEVQPIRVKDSIEKICGDSPAQRDDENRPRKQSFWIQVVD